MTGAQVSDLLYQQSGLLGVSGLSDDMRTLLASDLASAKEAVALFVYRIGRELGSLAAALGGLDALVFTAGIGERAPEFAAAPARTRRGWVSDLTKRPTGRGGPRITHRQPLIGLGGSDGRRSDDRPPRLDAVGPVLEITEANA